MKTLKFLLILISLFYSFNTTYSAWDLQFTSNVSCIVTIKITSIPFEGLNTYSTNPLGNNRVHKIQNGFIHRRFDSSSYVDAPIVYGSSNLNPPVFFRMNSCFAEVVSNPLYGFNKYLITFYNINNPERSVSFYYNTLDSKLGCDTVGGDTVFYYKNDKTISYQDNGSSGWVTLTFTPNGFKDTVYQTNPLTEFKIWKAFFPNREDPVEKKFYARTTPFPISPEVVKTYNIRNLTLGTKVVLDTVYQDLGSSDNKGYNTVDDEPFWFYRYPPIPDYSTNNIEGETFVTPAFLDSTYLTIKLTAESGDTLILKKRKRLWINGIREYNNYGDTIIFKPGSCLIKEDSAKIFTSNYGVLIDSGCNSTWNNYTSYRAFEKSSINFSGTNHTVNNGGSVIIDGNAYLRLGDNTTLTFDGSNSYLKLKQNSLVELGNNAKIKFINGAGINADGATFNSPNGIWEGMEFVNASPYITIQNCNIQKAKKPIKINNETSATAFGLVAIKNNDITLPNVGCNAFYGKNVFALYFDGNDITLPVNSPNNTTGIYIQNFLSSAPPDSVYESDTTDFNFRIITNNTISNGTVSMILANYAAGYNNFYVSGNTCNGTVSLYNLMGLQMTGDIKNNSFGNSNTKNSLYFAQSNPNIYNNIIHSDSISIISTGNSYPNLSPNRNVGDQFVWTGGRNNITSQSFDNLHINGGYVYTNYGSNYFTVNSSSEYHMYGWFIDTVSCTYNSFANCWYPGGIPHTHIWRDSTCPQILVNHSGPLMSNCPEDVITTGYTLVEIGDGVFDTVFTSVDDSGIPLPEDERIHTQAIQYMDMAYYLDAIASFKNLIDNHIESTFLNSSLYDLYSCYESLDTTSDQDSRDILYGNLKTYLEEKINSENYDSEFEDIAFEVTLMCDANMEEYNSALTGYEFIALFHPDPTIRLYASWDFAVIEELLGTGGGLSKKHKQSSIKERYARIEKIIDDKPLLKKMKDNYQKGKDYRNKKLEKQYSNRQINKTDSDRKLKLRKDMDAQIEIKARTNLYRLSRLSEEEKEKELLNDLLLSASVNSGEDRLEELILENPPMNYSLSQNYPNPFNPTSTINYELPKDGTVKLIIYDMLGREVSKLVNNEFKVAGRYSVVFDGSGLSSGIYFYKIEAGSFTDIKRMLMIK